MKIRTLLLPTIAAAIVALGTAQFANAATPPPPPPNMVLNAGFEDWSATTVGGNLKTTLVDGMGPTGWEIGPETFAPKDNPGTFTGAVYKDTAIKHGGAASVRLESGRPVDIVGLTETIPVEPNTKYQITGWYKADNLTTEGDGPYIWAVFGPTEDYWSHMTFKATRLQSNTGTFDWTKQVFTFDTNETAGQVRLTLQLRRASGKLWFDDVELIKLGPVTPVKAF